MDARRVAGTAARPGYLTVFDACGRHLSAVKLVGDSAGATETSHARCRGSTTAESGPLSVVDPTNAVDAGQEHWYVACVVWYGKASP